MLDLNAYFEDYNMLMKPDGLFEGLEKLKALCLSVKSNDGKLIFVGNGASAAIASHAALDFTKQGNIRAITFHDPSIITAYVNDFGGSSWLAEACKSYVDPVDAVFLISVSGESPNLIKAADWLNNNNIRTASLTGRSQNTSLGKRTNINLSVETHAYNIVECIHMIWITTVIDMVIGRKIYAVN